MSQSDLDILFSHHPRDWRRNLYVYPVLSRRSGGVSVGVNLNPDKACNFDCIYCQVDRTIPPAVRKVDLTVLAGELDDMLRRVKDGRLFAEMNLGHLPAGFRRVNDIAFSGDGEPTASPTFPDAVRLAAETKARHNLDDVKIVLITDACYLTRPPVRAALAVMDENNGEIWAKLDAGTQQYFQQVCRPNVSLEHVLENIHQTARVRPVVIQSLWMQVHGNPPPDPEVRAFCGRLNEIQRAGGTIKLVQVYTIARRVTEPYATPLSPAEVDHIAEAVSAATAIPTAAFYGSSEQ